MPFSTDLFPRTNFRTKSIEFGRLAPIAVLALVASFIGFISCRADVAGGGVTIIDTGLWSGRPGKLGALRWVDDDQLLVLGRPSSDAGNRFVDQTDRVLYSYRLSDASAETWITGIAGFCAVDDRLLVQYRSGVNSRFELRSVDEPREAGALVAAVTSYEYDSIGCQVWSHESSPGSGSGRRLKPLRKGHGMLDRGPRQVPGGPPPFLSTIVHVRPDGSEVDSGIAVRPRNGFAYARFREEYLFYESDYRETSDASCTMPIKWLSPKLGFKAEGVEIDCGLLLSGGIELLPTRAGVLAVHVGSGSADSATGGPGIHLIGADRPGRVISGVAATSSVSPNGCLVAIAHAADFEAKRRREATVKILDFCELED